MSEAYHWIAHQQAVERFLRLKSLDRQFLLDQFDRLAADPFQVGDTNLMDAEGHQLQLKICGRFIITCWVDHAAKELRIVAIETV